VRLPRLRGGADGAVAMITGLKDGIWRRNGHHRQYQGASTSRITDCHLPIPAIPADQPPRLAPVSLAVARPSGDPRHCHPAIRSDRGRSSMGRAHHGPAALLSIGARHIVEKAVKPITAINKSACKLPWPFFHLLKWNQGSVIQAYHAHRRGPSSRRYSWMAGAAEGHLPAH